MIESENQVQVQVCLVCWSTTATTTTDSISDGNHDNGVQNWRDNESFADFLGELENREFRKDSVLKCLEEMGGRVVVCLNCSILILEALEARKRARDVELQVIKLQRQVVEEMKRLGGHMREFYGKMRRIEGGVKRSNLGCLKGLIGGGNDAVGREEGMRTRRGKRKIREEQEGERNLIMFRERITEVLEDLASFWTDLTGKTGSDSQNIWNIAVADHHRMQEGQEAEDTPALELASTSGEHDSDSCQITVKDEPFNSPIGLVAITSDDEDEEIKMTTTEVKLNSTTGQQDNDEADPDDDEQSEKSDTDSSSDFEVVSARRLRKNIRKLGRGDSRPPQNLQEKPPARRKRIRRTTKPTIQLATLNFEGMSDFKKEILQAVIRRQLRYEHIPSPEDTTQVQNFLDLPVDSRYLFRYDDASQKITISDTEVIVKETSVYCTICDFSTSPGTITKTMESIYNHVAGKHFDAFQCHLCPKRFLSRKKFKEHYSSHKKVDSCICDICGKPLGSPETVGMHKWLHLNEEEKAESLRNGSAPSVYKRKMKAKAAASVSKPTFKCNICHKEFGNHACLREHKSRHTEGTIVCPKCGKELKRTSYRNYHMRYTCPLGTFQAEMNRKWCLKCNSSFATSFGLQNHIKRMHPKDAVERPYLCTICGKGFKAMWDLNNHSVTHSEERPWKCDKCGKGFNMKRNLQRHNCRADIGVQK